jgi:hypothetical protein
MTGVTERSQADSQIPSANAYIAGMAERNYPTRHTTLASLRAAGIKLFAFCNNPECRWSSVLDTDELIAQLGAGYSTLPTDMVPRLVCSQCGTKDVGTVLTAADEVPDEAREHIRQKRKTWDNQN